MFPTNAKQIKVFKNFCRTRSEFIGKTERQMRFKPNLDRREETWALRF